MLINCHLVRGQVPMDCLLLVARLRACLQAALRDLVGRLVKEGSLRHHLLPTLHLLSRGLPPSQLLLVLRDNVVGLEPTGQSNPTRAGQLLLKHDWGGSLDLGVACLRGSSETHCFPLGKTYALLGARLDTHVPSA